jgi:hypothetical protein
MHWQLGLWQLGALFKIDAQQNPAPAILLTLLIAIVLLFLVSFARHRDENRKARGDLSGWRSRERRP